MRHATRYAAAAAAAVGTKSVKSICMNDGIDITQYSAGHSHALSSGPSSYPLACPLAASSAALESCCCCRTERGFGSAFGFGCATALAAAVAAAAAAGGIAAGRRVIIPGAAADG
jgi:hypothetical protein